MMERLKGHTEIIRLLEMIRSCFCITVNFYKHLSAKADKKTKRKRNKRWLCMPGLCLCRILLVFFVGSVRWAAVAIFAL